MTVGSLWPNCRPSDMVTLRRADGLVIAVHRDVADLVTVCYDVTEAMGYDLKVGWCWGVSCRPIAGTKTPSRHSDGSAVDNNAPTNPRRADRKFQCDQPRKVIDFWKGVGWRWGGDFSWPDPMHYEWPGTGAEARQKARDLRAYFASLGGNTPPPAVPIDHQEYNVPTLRIGSNGLAVRKCQALLVAHDHKVTIDGDYGSKTADNVRWFQALSGLEGDAICGPRTWRALIEA